MALANPPGFFFMAGVWTGVNFENRNSYQKYSKPLTCGHILDINIIFFE